jgi:hypothetical protein
LKEGGKKYSKKERQKFKDQLKIKNKRNEYKERNKIVKLSIVKFR